MRSKIWGAAGVMAIALVTATSSFGATANVLGTDDIYAAGGNSVASAAGGTTPASIALGTATSVTFSGASGTVCLATAGTTTCSNANGIGGNQTSSNAGLNFFSGIPAITNASGYLTGVFFSTPSGSAPGQVSTAIPSTLTPALNQVFIIGSATNTFTVPGGATSFALGISDACGYAGSPSCYADNTPGTAFTVTYTLNLPVVNNTPVPPSILLTLIGLA